MAVEIALALNTVNGSLNGAEEKQITEAGRDLFTAMVLKTWIADAKEAIYEAEDLLIEIDNEARRTELVAGSQTGMLEDKARSLHLMKQPPSHERVPSTSLLGHTRVYGRDQSKEAIKKLLLSDDAEGESLQGSRDRKPTARVLNSEVSSVKERTPYDSPAFDLRRRPQGRAVTCTKVRDTVAVLNAQKSISKEDVVFLLMAEGFLLVYDRNKEMKETRYIYFEDLVLMFLFEQDEEFVKD
ncbi:hypothetical protein POTOM_054330 [Populus tomentosa]|uniref:Uncharacterized protein n=1 Tax=Populus tomentosa TaxID=118781 RepID=A0A8X8C009_POPTO|nr:hypothetical protein POTOM_054330 [Populus tomentosa]